MHRPRGDADQVTAPGRPGDAPARAPRLLLVAGEGLVSMHELDERPRVIGRSPDCDVVLDHRALSRRHAAVRIGPPPTVQDLGSTNGTLVAGAVHHGGEPIELVASDRFQIGPFSFVLITGAPEAARSMS